MYERAESSQVQSADPQQVLATRGYLTLDRPFDRDRVSATHESVQCAFAQFVDNEECHRTLYEISDEEESHVDPRFYEQGCVAIPMMDFKGREGYKQLMMSLAFSAEFAAACVAGNSYEWGTTHGPEEIKKSVHAFSSVLDLFSIQAMGSIFLPIDEHDNSYCGFLLNDSAPHSVCFGYHYELHQDRHENAIVISVQLSPTDTPWKIGRDLDNLDTVMHHQGSMIVMEAHDYGNRMSPWHMPCIGDEPRNAAVAVFEGTYRDRFITWLLEHATACGYGDAALQLKG